MCGRCAILICIIDLTLVLVSDFTIYTENQIMQSAGNESKLQSLVSQIP